MKQADSEIIGLLKQIAARPAGDALPGPITDAVLKGDGVGGVEPAVAGVDYTMPTYLVYTALLTQNSNFAPVATVLENTLGITPHWVYAASGIYDIDNLTCDPQKIFLLIGQSPNACTTVKINDEFNVRITIVEGDAILDKTTFEMRVYP